MLSRSVKSSSIERIYNTHVLAYNTLLAVHHIVLHIIPVLCIAFSVDGLGRGDYGELQNP